MFSNSNNFIERSIRGAFSFFKESIFADEFAAKEGFLQSLDPRVKVITFLMFILAVLLTKSIAVAAGAYIVSLALAAASRVKMGFFLKRTWVFIPLFSLFIAIPALFNVFSPGEAIGSLQVFGHKLIITRQGLHGAGLFLARVVASVSFAVLLSITTRHFVLLRVLRIFRVPQIFVMTLGMCYRYIYLLLDVIENTFLAIKSRVGGSMQYKKGQQVVAWNISALWSRSYYLSESVYSAMLSRGYRGEPVLLDEFKTRTADWVWLGAVTGVFIAGLICLK